MEEVREVSTPCPYIQPGRDSRFICTGTSHIRGGGLKDLPCPLWNEASQWARAFGIRGDFTLDSMKTGPGWCSLEIIQTVSDWIKNPTYHLLLASPPGRGKSRLALGAWYALRRNLTDCLITTAPLFLSLGIRASMGKDEDRKLEKFVGKDLIDVPEGYFNDPCPPKSYKVPVVFDDLGSERTSDVFLDTFEQLLNYKEGLLITTNLGQSEIDARYNGRISSRLGRAEQCWIEGDDLRFKEVSHD